MQDAQSSRSLNKKVLARMMKEYILLNRFARMTDEDLGTWIVISDGQKEDLIDIIEFAGEKRLASSLRFLKEEQLAHILNNVALDLLIAYDEVDKEQFDIMPPAFDGLSGKSIVKQMLSGLAYDDVATVIVILYRREKLLELLKKHMLTCEDVTKLVVEFYTDIMDN